MEKGAYNIFSWGTHQRKESKNGTIEDKHTSTNFGQSITSYLKPMKPFSAIRKMSNQKESLEISSTKNQASN